MSAVLGLHRLQSVDRQLDRVRTELLAIEKELANNTEVRRALEEVEASRLDHAAAQAGVALAQAIAERQDAKLKQVETQLYGGKVGNPKELEELQAEVYALERHLASLEAQELEALERAERAENALSDAETRLAQQQASSDQAWAHLAGRRSGLETELDRLETERAAALSPISPALVREYEELRRSKRGLAVTEIIDQACSACGTTLTAAFQQSAHSPTQVQHCPTCGRIVYAL